MVDGVEIFFDEHVVEFLSVVVVLEVNDDDVGRGEILRGLDDNRVWFNCEP